MFFVVIVKIENNSDVSNYMTVKAIIYRNSVLQEMPAVGMEMSS